MRAERRTGELLREREKHPGARSVRTWRGKNPTPSSRNEGVAPPLKSLGITRDQSSDWQRLAKIPEPERPPGGWRKSEMGA